MVGDELPAQHIPRLMQRHRLAETRHTDAASHINKHVELPRRPSADRNYNFFDELDARLTDVENLDVGSGEKDFS